MRLVSNEIRGRFLTFYVGGVCFASNENRGSFLPFYVGAFLASNENRGNPASQ